MSWWTSTGALADGRLATHGLTRTDELSLNGTWRFQLLAHPEEAPGPAWQTISVPGVWTMQDVGDPPAYLNIRMPFALTPPWIPEANLTGIYDRTFALPDAWRDDRVVLSVGGVEGALHVRMNGSDIGFSKGNRVAAEFDITDVLQAGSNTVTIRVVKWSDASYVEDQDQWRHSGISRGVRLYRTPHLHVADAEVRADYDPETGESSLHVRARVENGRHHIPAGLRLEVQILGHSVGQASAPVTAHLPAGQRTVAADWAAGIVAGLEPFPAYSSVVAGLPASEAERTLGTALIEQMYPAAAGSSALEISGLHVRPWSAEDPQLYAVALRLVDEAGITLDATTVRTGFRRVAVIGRDLLVNGRRVWIQGVNRHDYHPRTGRTRTREEIREELSQLKRFNINAIRTAHYPSQPELYELTDELGFYVVDEADIESHAHRVQLAEDERYLPHIVDRVSRLVLRDRNHPSVIVWSLGNEAGTGASFDAAAAWVRGRDDSRPVQYEGSTALDWNSPSRQTDILAPMYPPVAAIIAHAQDERARRPLIMCEYQHAMGNSNGGLQRYWNAIRSTPGLQGGFIWELWDHGLDPDGDGRYRYGGDFGETEHDGNFCIDGLLFPDGSPHPAMYEVRHVFSPVEIALEDDSVFVVSSRRHFVDLDDLRFDVSLVTHDGTLARVGEFASPDVAPGGTCRIPLEWGELPADSRSVRVVVRHATARSWAQPGDEIDVVDLLLAGASPRPRPQAAGGWHPGRVDDDGLLINQLLLDPPRPAFWRALTDNDRSRLVQPRLEATGLREPRRSALEISERPDAVAVRAVWSGEGVDIEHTQIVRRDGAGLVQIDERFSTVSETADILRLGVVFTVAREFDHVEWVGDGPHECYADRRASAVFGAWGSSVDDLHTPYVRPQENGARTGVTMIALRRPDGTGIRIRTDRPVQMTVSRHAVEDLENVGHEHDLVSRDRVHVHLDAAHRGIGSASVGPDTDDEHRIRSGVWTFTWWIDGIVAAG